MRHEGVTFASMKTRSFPYYARPILGLVLGIADASFEDFPENTAKPWQARVYDALAEAVIFLFSTSGVMGTGNKCWSCLPHRRRYPPS